MDRLARDSVAAQKAGMTYGKWKVLHPYTDLEEAFSKDAKLCEICGKPIPTTRVGSGATRRKYCSPGCSYEATVIRNREFYQKKKERMMASGEI